MFSLPSDQHLCATIRCAKHKTVVTIMMITILMMVFISAVVVFLLSTYCAVNPLEGAHPRGSGGKITCKTVSHVMLWGNSTIGFDRVESYLLSICL